MCLKIKTLNTSFWWVENVEYANQSASISIKNVSIWDLPVGVFTPQSLIHFSFVIYEVAIWLICHLIKIGCYNPSSINDITLMRHWKSTSWCLIDALGQILNIVSTQYWWLQLTKELCGFTLFSSYSDHVCSTETGNVLCHSKRFDNIYYYTHKVVSVRIYL